MEKRSPEECEKLEEGVVDVKILARDVDDFKESRRIKKQLHSIKKQIEEACEDD